VNCPEWLSARYSADAGRDAYEIRAAQREVLQMLLLFSLIPQYAPRKVKPLLAGELHPARPKS